MCTTSCSIVGSVCWFTMTYLPTKPTPILFETAVFETTLVMLYDPFYSCDYEDPV